MSRVTLKSSTIFISIGDKTRVYRSVDDVPPRLRKKLEQSTNGLNSATILIADRRGRQEIARAIRGLPSGVRPPVAPQVPGPKAQPPVAAVRQFPWVAFLVTHWKEILLPSAIGVAVWYLSGLK